jgi:GAF domain-containing protein
VARIERLSETLQRAGYQAAAAAPVLVGGRLWGALGAATRSDELLPDGLEQRLCGFAELVAGASSATCTRARSSGW